MSLLSAEHAHKRGNRDDQEKFKQLRNRVVSKLRSAKKEIFTNLHPHITNLEFWKLIKSVKSRSNIFPTLELGDTVTMHIKSGESQSAK